jgi:hypothetical protein
MKPKQIYKHAGNTFELFKAGRLKDAKSGKQRWKVIYRAKEEENVEVLILNEVEPNPLFNPDGENTLSYPKSEAWGRLGWSFRDLAAAEKKYELIKDEEE